MFGLFDPTQDPLTATSQQLLGSIRSQVMLSSKIASTSEGSIASSSAAVHTFRVIPSGYSTHVTPASAPRQQSLGSVTRVLTLVSEGRL